MSRIVRPSNEVTNLAMFHDEAQNSCRERLDSDGFIDVTMEEMEESAHANKFPATTQSHTLNEK